MALSRESESGLEVAEDTSDGASRLGVRYPVGVASFGVRGDLLARWKAALRVGVKGLFCLSGVILAGEGDSEGTGERLLMALRQTAGICKHDALEAKKGEN